MSKSLWLRLTAGLSLLVAVGHSIGFSAPAENNAVEAAARRAMQGAAFDLAGTPRNYWQLYMGFGLIVGVLLALQAVTLWLLADQEKRRPGEATAMIAVWLVGNLIMLGLDWRYLFIVPQVTQALISLLLAMALFLPTRPAKAG